MVKPPKIIKASTSPKIPKQINPKKAKILPKIFVLNTCDKKAKKFIRILGIKSGITLKPKNNVIIHAGTKTKPRKREPKNHRRIMNSDFDIISEN